MAKLKEHLHFFIFLSASFILLISGCEKAVERQVLLPPESVLATDGEYVNLIEVRWSAVEGAQRYVVYRKAPNSSTYQRLGEVSGNKYSDSNISDVGVDYFYRVRSSNANGFSSYSNEDKGYLKVPFPINLTSSKGDVSRSVSLSWQVPNELKNRSDAFYEIYVSLIAGGSYLGEPVKVNVTNTSSYSYSALEVGKVYYFTMRSFAGSYFSEFSNTDSGWTSLESPHRVSASKAISTNQIVVSWPSIANVTGYKIYRREDNTSAWSNVGTVLASGQSTSIFTDNNVLSDRDYYYDVTTLYNIGQTSIETPHLESRGTDINPSTNELYSLGYLKLQTPVIHTITQGSAPVIKVNWNYVFATTNYIIYKKGFTDSSETVITSNQVPLTGFTDESALPGKKYSYNVAVYRGQTRTMSDRSGTKTGWAMLQAPTGFAASKAIHFDRVELSWDRSAGAMKYLVLRAFSGGSRFVEIGQSTDPSYTDIGIGLNLGQKYYYYVKAFSDVQSLLSETDSGWSIVGTPINFRASGKADGNAFSDKIELFWQPVSTADSYRIFRDSRENRIAILPQNNYSYTDLNLGSGEVHYYYIQSISSFAKESQFAIDTGTTLLNVPTGLRATENQQGFIRLTWRFQSSSVRYRVYRKLHTSLGSSFSEQNLIIQDTVAIDNPPNIKSGSVYDYYITAYNDNLGESDSSNVATGYSLLTPPDSINASDGKFEDKIEIHFKANTDKSAEAYHISRSVVVGSDTTTIAVIKSSENKTTDVGWDYLYEDRNVTSGVKYLYSVASWRADYLSKGNAVVKGPSNSGFVSISPPEMVSVSRGELEDCLDWQSFCRGVLDLLFTLN